MENIEIVFSFDTTGSMNPCLSTVRREIHKTVSELFSEIPGLKIGIIAHGDYCDKNTTYVTKHLALTSDANALSYFVNNVERTYGGDAPECYELVLHEARSLAWSKDAKKLLVIIGDDVPHAPAHNPGRLDWRTEAKALTDMGVLVHGVQCLNRSHSTSFYRDLANMTGGIHISLAQFGDAVEMFKAIAYQQESPEALQKYEEKLVESKKLTRTMDSIFTALSRRDPKTGRYRKVDARSVDIGRFQVARVDADIPIKDLVESIGAEFERGRGYYEFTKRETIQAYKEIILMNNETGDMYEGAAAREILGLPADSEIRITPSFGKEYTVFVQSTSNNRKLIGGTKFLYEAK
jgi:hypothetical protein